jgi:IclR family KDG regulon transcriptional repressor
MTPTEGGNRDPRRPASRQLEPAARQGAERETSIRRGVEVLLSLAGEEALAAGGLGVTQISELLGREKSQVSRALKALNEYGLVERSADSSYRLGWRLYALAQLAGERRLLDAAAPRLRELAASLGERVHLSVLQGPSVLTVLSESPGRAVEAVGWTGRVTPAYCTSAGRALLLDASAEDIRRRLANVDLVALGPNTVRSLDDLTARVDSARADGYVVADGEFEPELIAVAVPIRAADGAIVASINVSAPRFRFLDRVDQAAQQLLAVSGDLSEALGLPAAADAVTGR